MKKFLTPLCGLLILSLLAGTSGHIFAEEAEISAGLPDVPTTDTVSSVSSASSFSVSSAISDPDLITIQVGEIIGFLPVTTLKDATYAWILTKDRHFLQADRTAVFETRPITPGNYTLTTEITSGDKLTRIRKVFTIAVEARMPGDVELNEGTVGSGSIIHTTPSLDENGNAILDNGQNTIVLRLNKAGLHGIMLDTDTALDTNGNGIADDDIDNDGTLFKTDGNPLVLWFANEITKKSMRVSMVLPDGSPARQPFTVTSFNTAKQEGTLQGVLSIEAAALGNRSYQFKSVFQKNAEPDTSLLYQWDFGDGETSLTTQPSHTFGSGSTFTVHLTVKDLASGKIIDEATKDLTVTDDLPITGSGAVSSGASVASASSAASSTVAGTSAIADKIIGLMSGNYIGYILIFLGCIVAGLILVFLLSRIRRRAGGTEQSSSLQKHFEQMEAKLVQKPQVVTPTVVAAAPVVRQTPPAAVAEREEKQTTTVPSPTPTIQAENAPSWLKQGLQGKPDLSTPAPKPTAPAPKPTPAPTPVTAAPVVAAKPTPVPQPAPVPVTPPKPQTPAPAPAPTPAAPEPAAAPAPAPKPASPSTPSWLKTTTPGPVAASSTPSWLKVSPSPTVEPKPAAAAPIVSAPAAPVQSTPTPTPAATPIAPAPVVAESKAPTAATPTQPSAPVAAPSPAPAKITPAAPTVEPTPAPAVAPVASPTNPAPSSAPVSPTQTPTPTPTPKPAAETPAAPAPATPVKEAPVLPQNPVPPIVDDKPVAFIRADNIGPQGDANTPPKA